jgi:hypothetical protein
MTRTRGPRPDLDRFVDLEREDPPRRAVLLLELDDPRADALEPVDRRLEDLRDLEGEDVRVAMLATIRDAHISHTCHTPNSGRTLA